MISKFYILVSVLLAAIAIVYRYNIDFSVLKQAVDISEGDKLSSDSVQLFTKESLSEFDGIKRKELYLSILGDVYDVTEAKQHYGPGQSYHMFTGRDASRSFITGVTENTSDGVADLPPADLLSLKQWQEFYAKKYNFQGKLTGKYYDDSGNPTQYAAIVEELIQVALKNKDDTDVDERQYPSCNVEWDVEHGTRVWCTNRSGGIVRDWAGFPRKYYKPGSESHRCACIQDADAMNPNVEQYDNCNVDSVSCHVQS